LNTNTSQNNPNLTTLFLPNEVLNAKTNLKLPLFEPKQLPKKSQESAINRKKTDRKKTRETGSRAMARLEATTGHR